MNILRKLFGGKYPQEKAISETQVLEDKMDIGSELLAAATNGNLERVKQLIDGGADVNTKNRDGLTPLHYAVIRGHRDVVELLISKGANVNAKANLGQTPLKLAYINKRKDVADYLISNGAGASPHDVASSLSERRILGQFDGTLQA